MGYLCVPATSRDARRWWIGTYDDDKQPFALPDFDDQVDATGRAIDSQPAYDELINVELVLPQNGEYQPDIVTGQTIGPSGRPEGEYDLNPQLNTFMYGLSH
jgi:hypothetical protein